MTRFHNCNTVLSMCTFTFSDIDILNGLQWSAKLDTVFATNYKRNDNLLWQYFGSQSGFMRTYPGMSFYI